MRLCRLKYFAYTNPGLERVLQRELQPIVGPVRITNIFGKRGIEMRADSAQVIDVFLRCRTIRSLRVQVGHPIHASNLSFIRTNVQQINWTSFFNFKDNEYDFPAPVVRTAESDILSERTVRDAFTDCVGQIFAREDLGPQSDPKMNPKSQNLHHRTLSDDPEVIMRELSGEEGAIQRRNIAIRFPFHLQLFRNKLSVSLELFNTEGTKPGHKQFVGWGSVQESVAAAFFLGSGLADTFRETGHIRIFDPFCGSGTFLLEPLLMALDWPLRTKELHSLDLWKLNFVKGFREELEAHAAQATDPRVIREAIQTRPKLKVSLIGADLSKNQLSNAVLNFRTLYHQGILDCVDPSNSEGVAQLRTKATASGKTYFNFGEKAFFLNSDVGDFPDLPDELSDFVLITNIPFGVQSADTFTDHVYRRFDDFLAQNHRRFSAVFVMNRSNDQNERNYFFQSRFGWEPALQFSHGGLSLGFFRFSLRKQKRPRNLVKVTRVFLRRRRKPRVAVSTYDPSRLGRNKPNSLKMKQVQDLVRKKDRNRFLGRQKLHEDAKSRALRARAERADSRNARRLMGEVRQTLGESGFSEFQKRLK